MPLSGPPGLFGAAPVGAAVVVAPNVAVTARHNANLVPPGSVLAESDYDLLFFRTDRVAPALLADPGAGAVIVAYGSGRAGELRRAAGRVLMLRDTLAPNCRGCREQPSFSFDAAAGPGFSGGPVVDEDSGAVVGITFAFCLAGTACGASRMFAFPSSVVMGELRRLLPALAGP